MNPTLRIILFITLLGFNFVLKAQTLALSSWLPDGFVKTISQKGNTIYLGGGFSNLYQNTPNGLAISLLNGESNLNFAKPNGEVEISVPDSNGGWYISGFFSKVGNKNRKNLARINADGTLNNWNPPDLTTDSTYAYYEAVSVYKNKVYITGRHETKQGFTGNVKPRSFILAFDEITNDIVFIKNYDGYIWVKSMIIETDKIYLGGTFRNTNFGRLYEISRFNLDGTTDNWNKQTRLGPVSKMAVKGDTLYVACGQNIFGINTQTGLRTNFVLKLESNVKSMIINGNTMYLSGYNITYLDGRNHIVAVDIPSVTIKNWNVFADNSINNIAINGNKIYLSGRFSKIGNENRVSLAELDINTALPTSWDAKSNDYNNDIRTLSINGDKIYVGGRFKGIRSVARKNLAAIDALTGFPTDWNPSIEGEVNRLYANSQSIFALTNMFDYYGKLLSSKIRSIDATSGIDNWVLNQDSMIYNIAVDESKIFMVGNFTSIINKPRKGIAALDALTGNVLDFNLNNTDGNVVNEIAKSNNTIFIAGNFKNIGGQSRNGLASFDVITSMVKPWNPNPNFFVRNIKIGGDKVFVVGGFSAIGGNNRNNIAALDTVLGNATDWDANPSLQTPVRDDKYFLRDIEIDGKDVYVTGNFDHIGGQPRSKIASLDINTGNATLWNPKYDNQYWQYNNIYDIFISNRNLYLGGYFYSIDDQPRENFAVFDLSTSLPLHFLSFVAKSINDDAILDWKTENEINTADFDVEKSIDGENFISIGNVKANNISGVNTYRYRDANINNFDAQILYYRLKQKDKNGDFEYSTIVSLSKKVNANVISLYPNPAINQINMLVTSPKSNKLNIKFISGEGKMVKQAHVNSPSGNHTLTFDVSSLTPGVYYLDVKGQLVNSVMKFIKQ